MKNSNLIFAYCLPATANAPTTRDGLPDNFSVFAYRSEEEYRRALDEIWSGRDGLNLVKDTSARAWASDDAVVFDTGEVMQTSTYLDRLWDAENALVSPQERETRTPAYRIKKVFNNFQILVWKRSEAEREVYWYGNQGV